MSDLKPRRGRPKGSGIDDSARLRSIAALMSAEPGLKPTTAIKRIGVSDPSIIRRLRDKFHACKAELMAELHGAAQSSAPRPAPAMRAKSEVNAEKVERAFNNAKSLANATAAPCAAATDAASVKHSELAKGTAPAKPAAARSAKSPTPRKDELPRQEFDAWLATMCGLGLQAISQAFETQLTLLAQFVRLPQVALVMRQQVALNDYALALGSSGARSRHH